MSARLTRHRLVLLLMAGLIILGIASKQYAGPGAAWSRAYLGGMVYVVFWSLGVFYLWPGFRPGVIAAGVLGVTCGLEVMQLWHPAWLQSMRATFLGAALLGSTFSWWDLVQYGLAALLAWGLVAWLRRREAESP